MSGLEDKGIIRHDDLSSRPRGNQVARSVNGASRAGKFRLVDVARALKAAQKSKVPIACIKIVPDGTILLITGHPETVSSSAPTNPWDGEP